MHELSVTLQILSATLTPSILLVICHNIISSTSVRQSRVMDRIRRLDDRLAEKPGDLSASHEGIVEIHRARLLQRAITLLYLSLTLLFVMLICIGAEAATQYSLAWFPAICGAAALFLSLVASLLLFRESSVTVRAINRELETFTSNIGSPPKH